MAIVIATRRKVKVVMMYIPVLVRSYHSTVLELVLVTFIPGTL